MSSAALELDRESYRRLVRLCAAVTRAPEVAEDLAQETIVEGLRHAAKLGDARGRDPWLAAIARNVCLRWQREQGRQPALAELTESLRDPGATDPELEAERRELSTFVHDALARLPAVSREVVVDRYLHERSPTETAARLGVTSDAVAMRLTRARSRLRDDLAAQVERSTETWRATRIWCGACGVHRLELRRDPRTIAFRCRSCGGGRPSAVFDLTKTCFARLLGDVVRPAAILRRAAEWSTGYFSEGAREVSCTGCGRAVPLTRSARASGVGLQGMCEECGAGTWSSLDGLVQALPAVREARARHPRLRPTRRWAAEHDGRKAMVVRFESPTTTAHVDVVVDDESLRVVMTC